MTFWAVFLWILQYLFQIPQNPTIFYTFFHKIAPFLHVYYTKFDKKFSFFENFGFSQKFPVGIGFFQSIKVVNIIFECWKVENVQSNKVDITSYSWTVWMFWLILIKKISLIEKKDWVWFILMWEAPGGQKISDYQNMLHRNSNQVSCNHFLPP